MRFDTWQDVALAAFIAGIAAASVINAALGQLIYRYALSINLGEHAAKLAEHARLSGEIALMQAQRRDLDACLERESALALAEDSLAESKAVQP